MRSAKEHFRDAVASWLERINEQRDNAAALDPAALEDARRLAELLDDNEGDSHCRFLLGWFHFYRCQALPSDEIRTDLETAIGMLGPCFLSGFYPEDMPPPLLPLVAEHSVPAALRLLSSALPSPDPDLIAAAIGIWTRILAAIPDDHPDRAAWLTFLAAALQARYKLTGDDRDLDEAISLGRQAAARTRGSDFTGAALLSGLVKALRMRFDDTGRLADLDEAIQIERRVAESSPHDRPYMPPLLSDLGYDLRVRFGQTGSLADLDEAVRVGREAVARGSAQGLSDDPAFVLSLANLHAALRIRSENTGGREDLDEAIQVGRAEIAATPAGDPQRALRLANQVNGLQARFERDGVRADLDEAIRLGRESVESAASDDAGVPAMQSNLGKALQLRSGLTGSQTDLEEAIEVTREAISGTAAGHPNLVAMQSHLGTALKSRFESTGNSADLDEAIEVGHKAVADAQRHGLGDAAALSNLGASLRTRFEREGKQDDLNQAILYARLAVAASPIGDPARAGMLSNLSGMLSSRFERTDAREDLDEAIQIASEALTAAPSDPAVRAVIAQNLGASLLTRFVRTGRQEDLNQAIVHARHAVADTTDADPHLAARLSNLGGILFTRFERTGGPGDLDEAVEIGRRAVKAAPAGRADRAAILDAAGAALLFRFLRAGAQEDLREAIAVTGQAVAETPADHPRRPGRLSHYGAILLARFEREGAQEDLDRAIVVSRQAVGAAVGDDPELAGWQSNLGLALRLRFERAGTREDVDEAIVLARQALAGTPPDHPDRISWLANLGVLLRMRFESSGAKADVDEAVRISAEAVAGCPADHPDLAKWLYNHGLSLRARWARAGGRSDRDEAIEAFEQTAGITTAAPSLRIWGARAAGELAAETDPERAAKVMEQAVLLLPEVAPRQLQRSDQQFALGGMSGLPGDAAALVLTAAGSGAPEGAARALRLLEAGRAVLFSQALEVRDDVSELTQRHPELAERFTRLRDLIDSAADAPAVFPGDAAAGVSGEPDRAAADRRRLVLELADTIAEIRTKERFGSFGKAPSVTELQEQAALGPVVSFNISRYRSDALILTQQGISSVPLPDLPMSTVTGQVNAFHEALQTAVTGSAGEREAAQRRLSETLGWLWDAAAGPVLEALGYLDGPAPPQEWPRIWWAPGGVMGLLPIHAAGHHDDAGNPHGRAVMDRVVSSFTPTISALRHARRPGTAAGAHSALIVAMPTTPGFPGGRLRFVPEEIRLLTSRLADSVTLVEPETPERDDTASVDSDLETVPTRANVFAHLRTRSVAHFACHGVNDPADPSRSCLLLHDHRDKPLTVSSLSSLHLDHVYLAYLSACSTALSASSQLIDEAIHLASGFQIAGYPHVIATLWAVDDRVAVMIADAFYEELAGQRGSAGSSDSVALALHNAVHTLRRAFPDKPSRWASHIQTGA
jgi:hypothetical protein